MTIKDKIIATGKLECYYCEKTKPAVWFGEEPSTGMVICRDCICELLEVMLEAAKNE